MDNQTPLHLTAYDNIIEAAKSLMECVAEIDGRDGDNQAPLHTSAHNNSTEAMKLLL